MRLSVSQHTTRSRVTNYTDMYVDADITRNKTYDG